MASQSRQFSGASTFTREYYTFIEKNLDKIPVVLSDPPPNFTVLSAHKYIPPVMEIVAALLVALPSLVPAMHRSPMAMLALRLPAMPSPKRSPRHR